MSSEPKRACGYRKVGGLYLCGSGSGVACDRLPFPLTICPTCHGGIKQSRGWTWVDVAGLTGGVHENCADDFACPFCMVTNEMGKAGLLWIGTQFYPTPAHFVAEADRLGISKRITAVPRNFKVGETWVLLAHPKVPMMWWSEEEKKERFSPAIFRIFRPARVEKIITESQSQDPAFMADLEKQKLTPVIVPDGDKDHQGTVYHDAPDETTLPFNEEQNGGSDAHV